MLRNSCTRKAQESCKAATRGCGLGTRSTTSLRGTPTYFIVKMAADYRNLEAIKSTEDESFLLSGILFYYEPSGQAF